MLATLLLIAQAYGPSAGPLKVLTENTSLTFEKKPLEMRVMYPEQAGRYPVIVLSHGFRGSKEALPALSKHLASHGYVVISPTFADSLQYLPAKERSRAFEKDFSNWNERPRQVSYILDNLPTLEQKIPRLKGKADGRRVGVGGHSFGAHTTMLLGGLSLAGTNFSDPRPKAFLLISPQGGQPERAYAKMTRPTMTITGSRDTSPITPDQTPEKRLDVFKLAPAGEKYLLWLEGADHSFGGINRMNVPVSRSTGQPPVPYRQAIDIAALAFFDAYVKGQPEGKKFLQSDELAKRYPEYVKLSRK